MWLNGKCESCIQFCALVHFIHLQLTELTICTASIFKSIELLLVFMYICQYVPTLFLNANSLDLITRAFCKSRFIFRQLEIEFNNTTSKSHLHLCSLEKSYFLLWNHSTFILLFLSIEEEQLHVTISPRTNSKENVFTLTQACYLNCSLARSDIVCFANEAKAL